jgi:lipopolysaccharide biosynthesis protein
MTFRDAFRAWRRNIKARMPYVRRREFRILQRRYAEIIRSLAWTAPLATRARLEIVKPLQLAPAGEVCFFVSHAKHPALKTHVRIHAEHLMRCGIQVVLVLNTDLNANQLHIDPVLAQRLSGVLARENVGFDFAAWAHAYALCPGTQGWRRLILVNDSIVGPLNADDFNRLMQRLRQSSADVVGLTENRSPLRFVHSYFLALNSSALQSAGVARMFGRMLSLPTKDQVIEAYETRLTEMLTAQGLRCDALFPPLQDLHSANDLAYRWAELIRAGFPYLKASVLERVAGTREAQALLPAEFLRPTA